MNWPKNVPCKLDEIRFCRLRFTLESIRQGQLPPFLGSTLRGGLAMAFRKFVCTLNRSTCDECYVRSECPYSIIFEKPEGLTGPSFKRMQDIPHPIVIEPPLQHSIIYRPGDSLTFHLVLIGRAINFIPHLIQAVKIMSGLGLGKNRLPFHLLDVHNQNNERVFEKDGQTIVSGGFVQTFHELVSRSESSREFAMHLLTPLRMRHNGSLLNRFDVFLFLQNACGRLRALMAFHHGIDLDGLDFRPLLFQEKIPQVVSHSVEWCDLTRYSNRQKMSMKIGGLVGHVVIRECEEAYWPVFLAAEEFHVGKCTIFGLGQIKLLPVQCVSQ